MDLQLTNKVALVTGASRGIGRAISTTLAEEGMKLALVARTGELLEELARSLPSESLVLALDLATAGAPDRAIKETVAKFGKIDVLINNAGATKRGDFLTLTDQDWHDGFALKFFAAMGCCRSAWPFLQASQGVIINIVGVGGKTPSAEFTIGGSVNAALLNLTKALADRGIRDGIRINAVNPGAIATDRLRLRIRNFAAEHNLEESTASEQLAKSLGVGRFGKPEEIGRFIAFLASPQASYCHGSIIDVDGGQTKTL